MTTTLVTGPARSGKSRHAEDLLARFPEVRYVATGQRSDRTDPADPEWSRRVDEHRARRPAGWHTIESHHLPDALSGASTPVLIDCLGTWLTAIVDDVGWEDLDAARVQLDRALTALLAALAAATHPVVLVTNEVGWSLVPTTASGRFFQDELGRVNAAVSHVATHVHLVVAGRVLDLSAAPLVPLTPAPRTPRA